MLANALTSLLISVTRRYAKVSASDAGIGISGGRLVLDDVELRADRLCSPALPFTIVSGRAQRLAVQIPWSALTSSPVQIEIDNIKLIAGPRVRHSNEKKPKQKDVTTKEDRDEDVLDKNHWYRTLLGRLLFNVAVELRGLILVYQDENCIGEVRLDEFRAFSCGEDWTEAFLTIEEDTQAVALRKRIEVKGLTWLFPPTATKENAEDTAQKVQKNLKSSKGDNAAQVYESRHPVINETNVMGRILVYAGEVGGKDGHCINIDLESDGPHVSFTARQALWLQNIIETSKHKGFRFPSKADESLQSPPKRDRAPYPEDDVYSEYSVASDAESYVESDVIPEIPRKNGVFSSFWDALIGEHGDDSVDDAEVALGYKAKELHKLIRQKPTTEATSAQLAVRNAVHSGGLIVTLRLVTPDATAREEIEKLKASLAKEKRFRSRFTDVEDILEEAEQRIAVSEAEVRVLKNKNQKLREELTEFEQAASEAARNKDAIIRHLQSTLSKTESELQQLRNDLKQPVSGLPQEDHESSQYFQRHPKATSDFDDRSEDEKESKGGQLREEYNEPSSENSVKEYQTDRKSLEKVETDKLRIRREHREFTSISLDDEDVALYKSHEGLTLV